MRGFKCGLCFSTIVFLHVIVVNHFLKRGGCVWRGYGRFGYSVDFKGVIDFIDFDV
jgi:hypothetical protein